MVCSFERIFTYAQGSDREHFGSDNWGRTNVVRSRTILNYNIGKKIEMAELRALRMLYELE